MKTFYPFYPWQGLDKRWEMKDDKVIPEVHVAEMLGVTRKTLDDCCKRLGIQYFREENVPRRVHAHWIFIHDLPSILRDLITRHILPPTWKESDIEERMRGLKEIQDRPRNGIRRKKQLVDEEEEEEEEAVVPKEPPVVPRKRDRSSESAEHQQQQPLEVAVSQQLKRMETMFQESLALWGDQGWVTFTNTDMWQNMKQKALQDALVADLPALKDKAIGLLYAKYEGPIQEEIRRKYEDKYRNNGEEGRVFRDFLVKQRTERLNHPSPQSPPPPLLPSGESNAAWVAALLEQHQKNLTE